MSEILILFASATTATRVKSHLLSAGFKARVIQSPKIISSNGCTYSVVSSKDSLNEAKKIALKIDVKIKGVFEIDNNRYNPVYY